MPAVKNVGEPCAGKSHARFEVAAGGNQASRASTCRAAQAPLADPTKSHNPAPRIMKPAALLARAREHIPQRRPRAQGAVADHELGLVHPAALQATEHARQALGALAVAVLDGEQLPTWT